MEKIKPCPFCGGTSLYFVTVETSGNETVGIFCNWCKQTVTLEENEWYGDTDKTRERAAEAWNRREGGQDEQD